jgi:hypothetical protein
MIIELYQDFAAFALLLFFSHGKDELLKLSRYYRNPRCQDIYRPDHFQTTLYLFITSQSRQKLIRCAMTPRSRHRQRHSPRSTSWNTPDSIESYILGFTVLEKMRTIGHTFLLYMSTQSRNYVGWLCEHVHCVHRGLSAADSTYRSLIRRTNRLDKRRKQQRPARAHQWTVRRTFSLAITPHK